MLVQSKRLEEIGKRLKELKAAKISIEKEASELISEGLLLGLAHTKDKENTNV